MKLSTSLRNATVTCVVACLGIGCGSDDAAPQPGTAAGSCDGSAAVYVPFDPENMANQLARVEAYDAIKATRKGASFSADDFGDLASTDASLAEPSADHFASLYVETASLADKVAGREDDHGYKLDYPEGEVGAYLDALIRQSITEGAAAGSIARDDVGSIDWHGQQIDKGLQHFFYMSVFHEMVLGARKNWDEAFGYYGRDSSGGASGGIASTVAARDENCNLGLNDEIYTLLIAGKCELEAALTASGADSVDVASVPALHDIIEQIDLHLLTAFAISAAREFRDLPTSSKPAIKLIEGRVFFGILEPFMMDRDATAAAFVRAEVDKDDPAQVDATGIVAAITETFGIEQTFAGCE